MISHNLRRLNLKEKPHKRCVYAVYGYSFEYLFVNCGARRAALRPYFFVDIDINFIIDFNIKISVQSVALQLYKTHKKLDGNIISVRISFKILKL